MHIRRLQAGDVPALVELIAAAAVVRLACARDRSGNPAARGVRWCGGDGAP